MTDCKGFIFDYGGTLDTHGNHWGKVMWHAYERIGVPVSEQQFRDAYVYTERLLGRNPVIKPDFTFRQTLDTKLGIQLQWLADECNEAVTCKMEEYHTALLNTLYSDVCTTVAESREVIAQLAESYPIVLVSNFYGNINKVLEEFNLSSLFCSVIESAVVGIRKPDPRIFALGVEAMVLQPHETVVVGDSLDKDILPALSLGCKALWYKGEPWQNDTNELIEDIMIISNLKELK